MFPDAPAGLDFFRRHVRNDGVLACVRSTVLATGRHTDDVGGKLFQILRRGSRRDDGFLPEIRDRFQNIGLARQGQNAVGQRTAHIVGIGPQFSRTIRISSTERVGSRGVIR